MREGVREWDNRQFQRVCSLGHRMFIMFSWWMLRWCCSRTLSIRAWSIGEKKILLMAEMEGITFMAVTSLRCWFGRVDRLWAEAPVEGATARPFVKKLIGCFWARQIEPITFGNEGLIRTQKCANSFVPVFQRQLGVELLHRSYRCSYPTLQLSALAVIRPCSHPTHTDPDEKSANDPLSRWGLL